MAVTAKMWANSADSHWLEPEDLWRSTLPPALAERMPRSVKDPDGQYETVFIDGLEIRRKLPNPKRTAFMEASNRPKGAHDVAQRLEKLVVARGAGRRAGWGRVGEHFSPR